MYRIILADYADKAHRDAVVEILDAYARDPMGGGEPLPEFTRRHLLDEMARRPNMFSLLTFIDDRPVGLANCIEGFSTFAARPLLNIHDLAVLPGYRGRGVGRALLSEIESIARSRGCCKVTLEVLQGNHAARTAYLNFGFKPYMLGDTLGNAEFWHKHL